MARFQYRAINRQGTWQEGAIEAESASAAVRHLSLRGEVPVEIRDAGEARAAPRRALSFRGDGRLKPESLMRRLAILTGAGLTLDEALGSEAARAAHGPRMAVSRLREKLRRGERFSEALAEEGAPFAGFPAALIASGEASGRLASALEGVARHFEAAAEFRSALFSALLYPALLLVASLASIFFMLIVVVPSFAEIAAGAGTAAPPGLRLLFGASKVAELLLYLVPVLLVGVVYLLRQARAGTSLRRQFEETLIRLPFAGTLIRRVETARFLSGLALALEQGVDLAPALKLSTGLVSQELLRRRLIEAGLRLRAGEPLAEALGTAGFLSPVALDLIAAGAAAGTLGAVAARAAEAEDAEMKRDVKRFLALLEPALVLVMGLIIGGLVLTLFGAISSLNALAI